MTKKCGFCNGSGVVRVPETMWPRGVIWCPDCIGKGEGHVCWEDYSCCCDRMGDEPSDKCPQHGGYSTRTPKCGKCGRFMKADSR